MLSPSYDVASSGQFLLTYDISTIASAIVPSHGTECFATVDSRVLTHSRETLRDYGEHVSRSSDRVVCHECMISLGVHILGLQEPEPTKAKCYCPTMHAGVLVLTMVTMVVQYGLHVFRCVSPLVIL